MFFGGRLRYWFAPGGSSPRPASSPARKPGCRGYRPNLETLEERLPPGNLLSMTDLGLLAALPEDGLAAPVRSAAATQDERDLVVALTTPDLGTAQTRAAED